MPRSGLRAGLVALLIAAAAGVGLVSIRSSRAALAVLEACDAVARGDTQRALALTRERVGPGDTGRAAAECRCRALIAQGDQPACAALLESLWSDPRAADWMPAADLAALAIAERRSQGRTREAAALARRAGLAHPPPSCARCWRSGICAPAIRPRPCGCWDRGRHRRAGRRVSGSTRAPWPSHWPTT
jgi:hypothetical protein